MSLAAEAHRLLITGCWGRSDARRARWCSLPPGSSMAPWEERSTQQVGTGYLHWAPSSLLHKGTFSRSAHGCDFNAKVSEQINTLILFSVITLGISLILCTVTRKLRRHNEDSPPKRYIRQTTLLHWS